VKAATVDAHGNPTAYHIRVRGAEDRPEGAPPPRGGIASSSVGLSGTPSAPPRPAPPERPRPEDQRAVDRAGRVDVGFGGPEVPPGPPPPKPPPPPEGQERVKVTVAAGPQDIRAAMQEEADQNFADEVASFFAELQAAETTDEEAKKRLIDELAMLVALFDTGDATTLTTPISKLAALKKRVQTVAPHLVGDFILLMQTGLRAWLGRV
ncbi:MAG TPA: hypothetical protein VM118_08735, partial [Acidobacteriota bacterium]|nr:hypothetical protein [Acidobacteriota bacterium]